MTNQEFIESIRLEGEEWKYVVGFEGRYMVSSFGRMASLYRPRVRSDGEKHHSQQHLLAGRISQTKHLRYRQVDLLRDDGTKLKTSFHREVAKAFIPNPNKYPVVDHLDCDGLNNYVSNLRWCTRSMNNMNPLSRARQSAAHRGIPNIKNSKQVVQLDNGKVIRIYSSTTECEQFGFSRTAIAAVCKGRRPGHCGFQWMYLSDYEKLQQ